MNQVTILKPTFNIVALPGAQTFAVAVAASVSKPAPKQ